MGLGAQQRPPFLSGDLGENGEHSSNPLTGPPDTYGFGMTGGVNRPRLVALDEWDHALGAIKARRPFNRGVPFCLGEE